MSHLLSWAVSVFGGDTATERGTQWGATVMSEQADDTVKMGSHTARFGATSALWFQRTGDAGAREQAARSLNWATYMCRDDGVVSVGEDANEGWWFSDGYGDYIRHFLVAMAAVPEWAPSREDHVLSSTSVIRDIRYAPAQIAWTTYDADATEALRLVSRPRGVSLAGRVLAEMSPKRELTGEGFTVQKLTAGGVLVRVRHHDTGEVVVTLREPGPS